jgi:transcriptional regulator of acetoin/glycerol metabolism
MAALLPGGDGFSAAPTPPPPFDRSAQRLTAQEWELAVTGGLTPDRVRSVVSRSWQRSQQAAVRPDLQVAPMVLETDDLLSTRERLDWLPMASRAVSQLHGSYGVGHVLTMFDADGRMVHADGDARALDGLAEINFRPGGCWHEAMVGTNGPGTALATKAPVHIVGAEHFCERWQQWHCAAVPLRDQVTGRVLGALDLSGPRHGAHPHTLDLIVALGVAVEQMLAARDVERRYLVVHTLLELSARHPGEGFVAIDRAGTVLFAQGHVPEAIRAQGLLPDSFRRLVVHVMQATRDTVPVELGLRDLAEPLARGASAQVVCDGITPIGAVVRFSRTVSESGTRRDLVRSVSREVARDLASSSPLPTRTEGTRGAHTRYAFADLVGSSAALAAACRVAEIASGNTLPVFLIGESGTGKEMFAQAIHAASARKAAPFVAVNCAALPRDLLEAELFGYVGGAFSGARREGHAGFVVAADGGTLFLDEIGELTPAAQAALLRVLQEGEVTAVGSTQRRRVNVRIIAATNRPIAAALADGSLREDLYYRLDVLRLDLPPLRERAGDVALLARNFVAATSMALGKPPCTLQPDAVAALAAYSWPGNVRELENVLRRVVAMAPGLSLSAADLPEHVRRAGKLLEPRAASPAAAPVDAERERTLTAVRTSRTMLEAARSLGITRSTLYRRLDRYGVRGEWVVRE